jgi:hypothetical protein
MDLFDFAGFQGFETKKISTSLGSPTVTQEE